MDFLDVDVITYVMVITSIPTVKYDGVYLTLHVHIYTIILLKSVCRRSQTAGRNYCSIVSGDVANGSYRLKVHPVTSSRLSSD